MILHCVFCNFSADFRESQRRKLLQDLQSFSLELPGVMSFEFGPNRDFEQKSQDYSDGFVIRFSGREALAHYADHPTHKALGEKLCEFCVGGAEGILVVDLEVPDRRAR